MPTIPDAEIQAASYRYLRIGLIALLLALGAAVGYQSGQQGFALASVSAYYYTPAQAIFVSALIGLGVCMIALQGLTNDEDVFLNLGGMFAMVVAVVPTGRGADFDTALRACRKVGGTLNQGVTGKPDCPSVLALQNATTANVENNMTALLIVGGLVLLLAAILLWRKRQAIPARQRALVGPRRICRRAPDLAGRASRPRYLSRMAGRATRITSPLPVCSPAFCWWRSRMRGVAGNRSRLLRRHRSGIPTR